MTDKFHSIQEDRFEREQGVRMVLAPFQPSTASSSNPNFLLPSNYEQVPGTYYWATNLQHLYYM